MTILDHDGPTEPRHDTEQVRGGDSPSVEKWRQRVQDAEAKIPLKKHQALYNELSWWEVLLERGTAQWIRWQHRRHRRLEVGSKIGSRKRDIASQASLERDEASDARWARRALAERRRINSPASRLARVDRNATRRQRLLMMVVVFGMAWSGVNVQHNLVPDNDTTDPLFWLSYFVELMISIPLVVLMGYAADASALKAPVNVRQIVTYELGLLSTTIALNIGPHLAAGDWLKSAEYGVAPAMVGVVIWIHAFVSARYAELREIACPDSVEDEQHIAVTPPIPATANEVAQGIDDDGPPIDLDFAYAEEQAAAEARHEYWQVVAAQMKTESLTARPVDEVADVLNRYYDRNETLRAIGKAHQCHHGTIGSIIDASESVLPVEMHRPRGNRLPAGPVAEALDQGSPEPGLSLWKQQAS